MDQTATHTPIRPLHNLPTTLTPFIGRGDESAQLRTRLREPGCRLLTITGAGGVGKTRLALQALQPLIPTNQADSPFDQGVYMVALAALGTTAPQADPLTAALASTLGIGLAGTEPPAIQLAQYLREKAMLLLLDNFEHVQGGAAFIADLLQAAPTLKILITSRQRLNMRGEHVIELAGMPFPPPGQSLLAQPLAHYDAVELFVRNAQALQPDFALGAENTAAVARICQLVEGLPLGIELAAAWIRLLSCDEIAQEIARNLDFLSSTIQDLPTRQQSLRAVFDYSWNLLSPAEQQTLRQLAIFHGSFSREAATAVVEFKTDVNAQPSILNVLATLVDKSLIRRVTNQGATRFEIQELLRQYLSEQLAHAGETEASAARHAAYYTGWMAARTAELRGQQQRAALAAISGEIDQVRTAWSWAAASGDSAMLGQASDSLFHFYDMHSWFHEGAAAFRTASRALASQADDAAQLVYGKLLARQGWLTFYLGHQPEAKALLERGLEILRRLGARAEQVFALNYLGALVSYLGDYEQTRALCHESLAITEAFDDLYGRAIACNILGQTAYACRDYAAAQAWSQQSFGLEQQIGNRWSMAFSLTNLGKVAKALGQHAEARAYFEQSLATRADMGDTRGVAICYNRLGDTALDLGNLVEAGQRYASSLSLFREIGDQWGMAESLINLGQLAASQERDPAARRLLHEALVLALGTQSTPQLLAILAAAVPVLRRSGQGAWANELAPGVAASFEASRPQAERLLAWSGADAALSLDQAIRQAQEPPRAMAAPETPAKPTAYPAGLTTREVAVLRLVAQGLTDAQVAEKLVLSPRTVSTHLSSIYGKLQISSRSAATRFAVEHGLV